MENKKSLPISLLIVYKIIGVIFLIIGLLTFFSTLQKFYRAEPYIPFVFLGYSIFGFIFAYGFFRLRKWIIPLLGFNFLSVTIIYLLKLTYLWNFSLKGSIFAFSGIFLAGLLLSLAYFSRNYLSKEYINLKVLIFFLFFWFLTMANYFSFIKFFEKCC